MTDVFVLLRSNRGTLKGSCCLMPPLFSVAIGEKSLCISDLKYGPSLLRRVPQQLVTCQGAPRSPRTTDKAACAEFLG